MIVYKIRLWAHHHLWARLMFEQILGPVWMGLLKTALKK